MKLNHVLESQQFDRSMLEGLFSLAENIRETLERRDRASLAKLLAGKVMCALFYEASTRTRFSFEMAAHLLGMKVIMTESAAKFSSAAKGETLADTIRIVGGYGVDVIVLRHWEDGASKRAARVIDEYNLVPHLINAGDGKGQQPTQALLDVYTIWREMRKRREPMEGVRVAIGGDLKHGRTVRSLAYLLKHWNARLVFVSPPELRIGEDIKSHLDRHRIVFSEEKDVAAALHSARVVYWTRLQRERLDWLLRTKFLLTRRDRQYALGRRELEVMRPDAIIMHPLPRVDEIAPEVDVDPRAVYFDQAVNGLYIRMALLLYLYGIDPFLM